MWPSLALTLLLSAGPSGETRCRFAGRELVISREAGGDTAAAETWLTEEVTLRSTEGRVLLSLGREGCRHSVDPERPEKRTTCALPPLPIECGPGGLTLGGGKSGARLRFAWAPEAEALLPDPAVEKELDALSRSPQPSAMARVEAITAALQLFESAPEPPPWLGKLRRRAELATLHLALQRKDLRAASFLLRCPPGGGEAEDPREREACLRFSQVRRELLPVRLLPARTLAPLADPSLSLAWVGERVCLVAETEDGLPGEGDCVDRGGAWSREKIFLTERSFPAETELPAGGRGAAACSSQTRLVAVSVDGSRSVRSGPRGLVHCEGGKATPATPGLASKVAAASHGSALLGGGRLVVDDDGWISSASREASAWPLFDPAAPAEGQEVELALASPDQRQLAILVRRDGRRVLKVVDVDEGR